MLYISTSAVKIVKPSSYLVFDKIVMNTGKAETFLNGIVSLFSDSRSAKTIYDCSFIGNVGGTEAGPLELKMYLDDVPIEDTKMCSTVYFDKFFNNVCARFPIMPTSTSVLKIVNTGKTPVIVQEGASLFIKRMA